MSDASPVIGTPAEAITAGRLLREARQAQGLHIAALASMIKVTPRKLELLEADRLDELPDATFTRALAQTVCRSLKIEAAPVLALLPPSRSHRLEKAGVGLDTRYHDRRARIDTGERGRWGRPALWAPVVLVLAAVAVYFMPANWWPFSPRGPQGVAAVESGASGAALLFPPTDPPVESNSGAATGAVRPAEALASASLVSAGPSEAPSAVPANPVDRANDLPAATPSGVTDAASAASAAPGTPKLLRVRTTADSWIQVSDAMGQVRLGRVVKAGETIDLDGAAPLKLRIGNAAATEVTFRGEPLALRAFTRNNMASLELK